MKRASTLFLMLLAAGAGALTHHFTEDAGSLRGPGSGRPASQRDTKASRIAPEMANLAAELLHPNNEDDAILFDDRLSLLKAEEFPLLVRELERQHPAFWNSPLAVIVGEYWSAVDTKGLLGAAMLSKNASAFSRVLQSLHYHDPEAVRAAVHRMVLQEGTRAIERLEAGGIGMLSPEDAATLLRTAEKEGLLKNMGKQGVALSIWAQRDPVGAVTFAGGNPGLMKTAMSTWLRTDPAAAIAWMKGPGQSRVDAGMREEMLLSFAFAAPETARRFVDEAHDKEAFLQRIAKSIVQDSPDKLKEYARHLDSDGLAYALVCRPPAEIAAWVKTLPESQREDICDRICGELAMRNTDGAKAFAELLPDLVSQPGRNLLDRFSNRNPVTAVEFLQSGKLSGPLREKALPQIVGEWLNYDRPAALAFIEAQPPSEAIGRLKVEASGVMTDGPDAARAFALSLLDEALRVGACRFILERNFRDEGGSNGEAVKANKEKWLAGIPDAVRKALDPPPPLPPPEPDAGDPFAKDPFAAGSPK